MGSLVYGWDGTFILRGEGAVDGDGGEGGG